MKTLTLTLLACISLSIFAQDEKSIDGRQFALQNNVWVEQTSNAVERTQHQNAVFGDETWQQWYRDPALKPILELGTNVVFSHDGFICSVTSSHEEVKFVSLLAPSNQAASYVSSEADTVGALIVSSAKAGQSAAATPNNPNFPTFIK